MAIDQAKQGQYSAKTRKAIKALTNGNVSAADRLPKVASIQWVRGHAELENASRPERLNHIADMAARLAAKRTPLDEAAKMLQNHTCTVLGHVKPANVHVTIHQMYKTDTKNKPVVQKISAQPGAPQFLPKSIYAHGCKTTRTGVILCSTGRGVRVRVLKFADSYKGASINELTAASAFILGSPAAPKNTTVRVTNPHIVAKTQKRLRTRSADKSLSSNGGQLITLHAKKASTGYRCSVDAMHLSVKPQSPTAALKRLLSEISELTDYKLIVEKVKEISKEWGLDPQEVKVMHLS